MSLRCAKTAIFDVRIGGDVELDDNADDVKTKENINETAVVRRHCRRSLMIGVTSEGLARPVC